MQMHFDRKKLADLSQINRGQVVELLLLLILAVIFFAALGTYTRGNTAHGCFNEEVENTTVAVAQKINGCRAVVVLFSNDEIISRESDEAGKKGFFGFAAFFKELDF